ncbi:MAG: glycosyltransferase, partial [Pseudomonadota bacterium]
DPRWVARARRALVLPFVTSLVRLAPQIWRWRRHGDLGAREAVKERLGLVPRSYAAQLRPELLRPAPEPAGFDKTVTLIMPVYNAFDLLRKCLERVERHTELPWRLVLVEDGSTQAGLKDWLRGWAAARPDLVHLLENPGNQGFVRSVNRGFERARDWPDDPVVLLNSDALVPAGWAARLIAPLSDPTVASVTPLSNDAEIFAVPAICQPAALAQGQGDVLDQAAWTLGVDLSCAAPTGVGFCMALSPAFLARVPAFDEVFAPGYGEEADWCQKTRAQGGRHVCASNLFVEHRGGASFGSVAKQTLLARNGAEISRRYPAYDNEVQAFIQSDPLTTPRLALGLSWAALQQGAEPVPVYLAHALGGGAESWLQARIAQDSAAERVSVVVRVGQGQRWKIELHTPHGVTSGLTEDADVVADLLARLPRRRIIYSCGVGDCDPSALPAHLLAWAGQGPAAIAGGAQPIEVLFHDFFPISPSYTLLGNNRVYQGLCASDTNDPAHHSRRPDGQCVDLAGWQAAWRPLLEASRQITVFSPSSRALVAAAYPDTAPIVVTPHAVPDSIPRISPRGLRGGSPVIGVLGNIGPHKGAFLLQNLSRDLAARGDGPRLVVIGQLAPEVSLSPPSLVHGAYRLEDLSGLVARYGIGAWLIPSVWPETFSFTTHEVLATGMPVFCFDLGAQADAVRAALKEGAPGGILPVPTNDTVDLAPILQGFQARIEPDPTLVSQ